MMKSEFESLAGRNVTDEQYKAIETLYMSSNLEKAEFVKSIRTMLKSIPQPEKKKDIKRMVVRDRSGYRKTPNGCYYHIEYVELVDIDIKTGKYIIKPLEDNIQSERSEKNMKEWREVFGTEAEQPEEFDTTASPTTVYQRRNIKKATKEDADGKKITGWQREEREMSREEYDRLTLMQEVVASNTTGIVESVTQFQKDAVIDEYTKQLIEEGLI